MSCAIAVMAKAPKAGRSKTRLVPALSPDQAAQLSAAFLGDITENLRLAGETHGIAAYVAFAPAGDEALFDGVLAPGTNLILADGTTEPAPGVAGFGTCLLHAVRTLVEIGYASVGVLNSDSPTLPTGTLRRAAELLDAPGDRAVLGPAEDGGYFFLGVKQPHARLFADIDWSTERVAEQTRARAAEIGLPVVELGPWYDVDDAPSLERLREDIANPHFRGYAAPYTAACLARFDAAEAA